MPHAATRKDGPARPPRKPRRPAGSNTAAADAAAAAREEAEDEAADAAAATAREERQRERDATREEFRDWIRRLDDDDDEDEEDDADEPAASAPTPAPEPDAALEAALDLADADEAALVALKSHELGRHLDALAATLGRTRFAADVVGRADRARTRLVAERGRRNAAAVAASREPIASIPSYRFAGECHDAAAALRALPAAELIGLLRIARAERDRLTDLVSPGGWNQPGLSDLVPDKMRAVSAAQNIGQEVDRRREAGDPEILWHLRDRAGQERLLDEVRNEVAECERVYSAKRTKANQRDLDAARAAVAAFERLARETWGADAAAAAGVGAVANTEPAERAGATAGKAARERAAGVERASSGKVETRSEAAQPAVADTDGRLNPTGMFFRPEYAGRRIVVHDGTALLVRDALARHKSAGGKARAADATALEKVFAQLAYWSEPSGRDGTPRSPGKYRRRLGDSPTWWLRLCPASLEKQLRIPDWRVRRIVERLEELELIETRRPGNGRFGPNTTYVRIRWEVVEPALARLAAEREAAGETEDWADARDGR